MFTPLSERPPKSFRDGSHALRWLTDGAAISIKTIQGHVTTIQNAVEKQRKLLAKVYEKFRTLKYLEPQQEGTHGVDEEIIVPTRDRWERNRDRNRDRWEKNIIRGQTECMEIVQECLKSIIRTSTTFARYMDGQGCPVEVPDSQGCPVKVPDMRARMRTIMAALSDLQYHLLLLRGICEENEKKPLYSERLKTFWTDQIVKSATLNKDLVQSPCGQRIPYRRTEKVIL